MTADAAQTSRRRGPSRRRQEPSVPSSFWRELPILVVIALGLAFLLKTFLIQAFYIPSGSMENTLQVGDRVMVNKLAYSLGDIQRGDVIVFNGVDSWDPEIEVAETGNPITRGLQSVAGAFGFASAQREGLHQAGHRTSWRPRQVLRQGGPDHGQRHPDRRALPLRGEQAVERPLRHPCPRRPAVGDG